MQIKKHLNFDALVQDFIDIVDKVPEHRRAASSIYSIRDIMLSALSCMYLQSSSLLNFQSKTSDKACRQNLKSVFKVSSIPSANAIKEFIDIVRPEDIAPLFKRYINKLQQSNILREYKFLNDKYLVALDGSQYFSSKKISCKSCLVKEHRKGVKTYSHQVLQASIVSPNKKYILPFMPEDIVNQDGSDKQDCEINASKRMLPKINKAHPRLNKVWLADSLYANSKFISLIRKTNQNDNFIFRAKEGDHKILYEHIDNAQAQKYNEEVKKGREILYYNWYNDVPLNASSDIRVNALRVYAKEIDRHGNKESTIVGTWITDIIIDKDNVSEITKAARSRWMIENECFNTLKNHGYSIDHSYGHGEKNLSFNFYTLTLLAFTMHQMQHLTEKIFQSLFVLKKTKKMFWFSILSAFQILVFESWSHMMITLFKLSDPNSDYTMHPT